MVEYDKLVDEGWLKLSADFTDDLASLTSTRITQLRETGKEAKMGSNMVTVLKDELVERMYAQPFPSEDIEMFQWIPKSI